MWYCCLYHILILQHLDAFWIPPEKVDSTSSVILRLLYTFSRHSDIYVCFSCSFSKFYSIMDNICFFTTFSLLSTPQNFYLVHCFMYSMFSKWCLISSNSVHTYITFSRSVKLQNQTQSVYESFLTVHIILFQPLSFSCILINTLGNDSLQAPQTDKT